VAEGTARKLVPCKCGRTMTKSENRGDSRKDGRFMNLPGIGDPKELVPAEARKALL